MTNHERVEDFKLMLVRALERFEPGSKDPKAIQLANEVAQAVSAMDYALDAGLFDSKRELPPVKLFT